MKQIEDYTKLITTCNLRISVVGLFSTFLVREKRWRHWSTMETQTKYENTTTLRNTNISISFKPLSYGSNYKVCHLWFIYEDNFFFLVPLSYFKLKTKRTRSTRKTSNNKGLFCLKYTNWILTYFQFLFLTYMS